MGEPTAERPDGIVRTQVAYVGAGVWVQVSGIDLATGTHRTFTGGIIGGPDVYGDGWALQLRDMAGTEVVMTFGPDDEAILADDFNAVDTGAFTTGARRVDWLELTPAGRWRWAEPLYDVSPEQMAVWEGGSSHPTRMLGAVHRNPKPIDAEALRPATLQRLHTLLRKLQTSRGETP